MTDAEIFLDHLVSITGRQEDAIREVRSHHPGMPPVAVFVYEHWPVSGFITAFTFGLSLASHPDWKFGRPELMISMESLDPSWPFAIGYLASTLRGDCPFSYGNTVNLRSKMSEGSDMDAVLIFAPPHLTREQKAVKMNAFTCHIAGVYPMYSSELPLYEEIGLESFWHHPGWDPLNERRPRLA